MGKISATNAKYIKLGEGGNLQKECFENKVVRINYIEVNSEQGKNREAIKQVYLDRKYATTAASNHATQVYAFYTEPESTIWITFADGLMYWCQAKEDVKTAENEGHERKTATDDGWSYTDINGKELKIEELSGNLTKTAGFRGTICNIEEFDYLLRKINGEEIDEIIRAKEAEKIILHSINEMMKKLHWKDFELFVDLVFANSGWRRTTLTGGTQKTIDFAMILPSTNESAFVQVKTSTYQRELEGYIEEMEERNKASGKNEKMFYVYHTPENLKGSNNPLVKLINAERLSKMALDAGLFDWLMKKIQ